MVVVHNTHWGLLAINATNGCENCGRKQATPFATDPTSKSQNSKNSQNFPNGFRCFIQEYRMVALNRPWRWVGFCVFTMQFRSRSCLCCLYNTSTLPPVIIFMSLTNRTFLGTIYPACTTRNLVLLDNTRMLQSVASPTTMHTVVQLLLIIIFLRSDDQLLN